MQPAASRTDPVTGSSETGSGFTVLGAGGGGLGYGGIDNSVALEMDTFYDSPWDPSDNGGNDDNHMALQSCGPGVANSSRTLGNAQLSHHTGQRHISTLVSNPNIVCLISQRGHSRGWQPAPNRHRLQRPERFACQLPLCLSRSSVQPGHTHARCRINASFLGTIRHHQVHQSKQWDCLRWLHLCHWL